MKTIKPVAALLAAVSLLSILHGCSEKATEAPKDTSVAVEVFEAVRRDIAANMRFSGKLYAESDVAAVASAPGKVTDLFVSVGDEINRGDKLFVIDAEDVMRQFKPAKDNYERTRALSVEVLAKGKKDVDDLEALFAAGAVSKSQVDGAKLSLFQQESQFLGQLDQLRLALDQLQSTLDDMTVRAPISGVVTAVNIVRGGSAAGAQPAVVISNTQTVSLKFDISESVFGSVQSGGKVQYSIPSLAVDRAGADIHSISPTPNQLTQLYTAEILLDNSEGRLTPGLFAEVFITIGQSEGAVVIPAAAVVNISGKQSVYIVKDDAAVRVDIETGIQSGDSVEVKSGLSGGEIVITKGQSYVDNGGKVRVVGGNA